MVNFVVSTPSLGFSAAAMTEAAALLETQMAQAQAVVDAVVGGTWTGAAADAFLADWTAFASSAAVTRTALIGISVRLQGAQSTYEVTEGQISAASRTARVNVTQPGNDGRIGTADDEQVSLSLSESVADSRGDLADLAADIKRVNSTGGAGA